jgi:hypothetical protein
MIKYRIARQPEFQFQPDVLWSGDALPKTSTVDSLRTIECARFRERARDPFLQARSDYLYLQRKRKLLGWRTVSLLHIFD